MHADRSLAKSQQKLIMCIHSIACIHVPTIEPTACDMRCLLNTIPNRFWKSIRLFALELHWPNWLTQACTTILMGMLWRPEYPCNLRLHDSITIHDSVAV